MTTNKNFEKRFGPVDLKNVGRARYDKEDLLDAYEAGAEDVKKNLVSIEILDLSDVGRMGGESHTAGFIIMEGMDKAKIYAENIHQGRPFQWKESGDGWTSGDLGSVMYVIQPLNIKG